MGILNLPSKGDHLDVARACDSLRRPIWAWLKQILTPRGDRLKTHKYDTQWAGFNDIKTWSSYPIHCWFSHDVTKFQTSELLILLRFYFHDVLRQLKTNIQTNFHSEWVLGLVIDYAWIWKLLRDVAFTDFTWRARELLCWFKRWLISGNSAIWTVLVLE